MPHLTTDDKVKLYYEETGTGTPVVFVHEFAGDVRSWEPQLRELGRTYRCIAYNARGYPPSDVPGEVKFYSQDRARDDIRAVLDALKIDKAHVVGLSMGGFASLHFGLGYPERARSIVVAGCGYGAAPDTRQQFAEEAEASAKRIEQQSMTKAAEGYALGPTRVQFQNKDPRGWREFADQLAEHSTQGAALTLRGVQKARPSPGIRGPARGTLDARRGAHLAGRAEGAALALRSDRQDAGDARAHPGHDRGRGLALPRARPADEAQYCDRGARRDAERRPCHQFGGSRRVQPAPGGFLPDRGRRPLADARPARHDRRDSGKVRKSMRSPDAAQR